MGGLEARRRCTALLWAAAVAHLWTAQLACAQRGGRIAELEAEIAALKAARHGGLRCADAGGPEANLVPLMAQRDIEGYNVTGPVVVELALQSAETLISLPDGKALRVAHVDVTGASFDPLSINTFDVWSLVSANGLSVLVCIVGVAVIAALEVRFGCIGYERMQDKLEAYNKQVTQAKLALDIIHDKVDDETAKKHAAQHRWARVALDIKQVKQKKDQGADFGDVVRHLMELRADDIRVAVNELVDRAQALADDEDTRAGAANLHDVGAASPTTRGDGGLNALKAGVAAIDTAKISATIDAALSAPKTNRYRALASGHIRAGAELETDKVGQLTIGEEIVVLSREMIGETERLQFDRGWVSLYAKSGKPILEPVAED